MDHEGNANKNTIKFENLTPSPDNNTSGHCPASRSQIRLDLNNFRSWSTEVCMVDFFEIVHNLEHDTLLG